LFYPAINLYPISIITLSTKAERYVVYSSNFETAFEACFSNRHDLNTDSNTLSLKVLSMHCVPKEINSVVCLTCIFSKCLS
jgi:hypothetical protein